MKRAGGSLGKMGKQAAQMGKAVAAAGLAAGVALGALIVRSIAAADNALKAAQGIGVTVEELTALRHAADISGVASEEFDKALARLARSSSDAAHGLQTQKRAFDALRISVTEADGTLRNQVDILGDVAAQFSVMEDGARKTALAQEIFGGAGTRLIPMLNQGRDGLKNMTDEAEALGLVISTDTARAAEEFQDNLTRLKRVVDGLVNRLSEGLLPKLVEISEVLLDMAAGTNQAFKAESRAIRALGDDVDALAIREAGLKQEIKSLQETLERSKGLFAPIAIGEATEELDGLVLALDFVQQRLERIRRGAATPLLPPDTSFVDPETAAQMQAVADAAERQREAIAAVVEQLREENETFGLSAEAQLRYRLEKMGATEETIRAALALAEETARMRELSGLVKATGKNVSQFGTTLKDSITSALTASGASLKSFAASVEADLQRIIVKLLVLKALGFLFGGSAIGTFLGIAAPKGRQHGGRVRRGEMVVVGEQGPELFVAGVSGQVATERQVHEAVESGNGSGGPVSVQFPRGPFLFDPSDVRQQEAFRRFIRDLTGRDVLPVGG